MENEESCSGTSGISEAAGDVLFDELVMKLEGLAPRLFLLKRAQAVEVILSALVTIIIPEDWRAVSTDVKNYFVARLDQAVKRRLNASERPAWAN